MIRIAQFQDIPRVIALLELAHKRTIYSQLGTVSSHRARSIVEDMGARMTSEGDQRSFFWVSQKAGVVQGFLIGFLQAIYQIGNKFEAMDLYTMLNEGQADPADFVKLISQFKKWAATRPDVVQVTCGITDVIRKDWRALVPVYEQLGFEQTGAVMTARFWK